MVEKEEGVSHKQEYMRMLPNGGSSVVLGAHRGIAGVYHHHERDIGEPSSNDDDEEEEEDGEEGPFSGEYFGFKADALDQGRNEATFDQALKQIEGCIIKDTEQRHLLLLWHLLKSPETKHERLWKIKGLYWEPQIRNPKNIVGI